MTITFRPEKREHSKLIIGLAGPTKSGKTMSAHRLAVGLANGGQIAKINAEGPNGHLYAERFPCLSVDIQPPFRPARFTEHLKAALALEPAVVIIDSASHMHDGPGGLLEYHEAELDRLAGTDFKKRDRMNWTAWIRPKAEENEFIYTMLGASCHIILCFRAKTKLKIVKGQEPIDLGWQPIAGDRITFETIFTLTLPPHSKGVPDLAASDMRDVFEPLIPDAELSEETGAKLAAWAAGGAPASNGGQSAAPASPALAVPEGAHDPAPGAAEPSELDEQEARLVKTLLALADKLGSREATEALIAKSQSSPQDKRIAWLLTQVERAEAVIA